ncbi:uncharacterized protein LOC141632438 [Silene latifolia]|uniref:uncharacterized protein LOC141632438 n=1 Tax=Silene latifolia TaxID=37657 RepID=UPI003D779B19
MSNMAAVVASRLNETVLRMNEALEKSKKHLLQRVRNFDEKIAEQQELSERIMNEKAKAAGNRCNMATAVDSLAENLTSVNEALEEISISDLKLNMPAAIPGSTENFRSLSVALEEAKKDLLQRVQIFDEKDEKIAEQRELSELIMNEDISTSDFDFKRSMGAGLDSLTENLQIVNETLKKAKKHLLQMIHENPAVKIDVKQDLAEQMMNEVQDIRAEVEKAHDELNNLEEKARKLDDMMKEFDGEQVELLSKSIHNGKLVATSLPLPHKIFKQEYF